MLRNRGAKLNLERTPTGSGAPELGRLDLVVIGGIASTFLLDAKTLENGAHFTFLTPHGSLDILSDPDGVPATTS